MENACCLDHSVCDDYDHPRNIALTHYGLLVSY